MNIHISARRFELTEAIRDYVERRLAALSTLHESIVSARVVLDHDDHHSARQYLVKAHLSVNGDAVDAEVRGSDLYEGVDRAVEKLQAQLRKIHDRQCSRRPKASVELEAALSLG